MKDYQWSDNYMRLEHLWETEQETAKHTWEVYDSNAGVKMRNLINLFLRLTYFIEEKTTPDSEDHWFQQIAYITYLRLPYNFKSIFDLWIKGYYLESCIILRHIMESFAQLRYFYNHRDQIKSHATSQTSKGRIKFITMFDEIAPGSYKKLYGEVLSHVAHGGIGTLIFRGKYTSPDQGIIDLRLRFDQTFAEYVITQTVGFGYGYLNYADLFFPSLMKKISKDIADKLSSYMQEYKLDLHKPKPTPEQQEFFENVIRRFLEK